MWDFNYKLDKKVNKYGNQISLDFGDACQTFMTGTAIGWLLTYNMISWVLLDALFVENPEDPKVFESIDMVRDCQSERYIICYS